MSVYSEYVLPWLCDLAMRNRRLAPYRERIVSAAEGHVLETDIGFGLNLPFYFAQARELLSLDPGPRLIKMARRAAENSMLPVNFIEGSAETMPQRSSCRRNRCRHQATSQGCRPDSHRRRAPLR